MTSGIRNALIATAGGIAAGGVVGAVFAGSTERGITQEQKELTFTFAAGAAGFGAIGGSVPAFSGARPLAPGAIAGALAAAAAVTTASVVANAFGGIPASDGLPDAPFGL